MLTPKQKKVLSYIQNFQEKKGYSASLEEIRKHFRVASISTAHYYVSQLQKAGCLKKDDYQHRGIDVFENTQMVQIPLLGTIAAGSPIEAIEVPDETIAIAKKDISGPEKHYALRVAGNSMIDEGIFDGDIVIIREQNVADDGQTVVAIIDDNEATLKKLYREKDRFRLQPANPTLFPIYRDEVEVRGIVVKIIRNLDETTNNSVGYLIQTIKKFPITDNVKRTSVPGRKEPKPFLQWVGGKREMIKQYERYFPKKINTYFEPFLGGGAVFFHLKPQKAVLNDSNQELISAYEGVRDFTEEVIRILRELKKRHSKDLYMSVRSVDREVNIFNELSKAELAARMIYLNQTGFNGVYRVNKSGQYNVPIGSSLNRLICDGETLFADREILKSAEILSEDFAKNISRAQKDDFMYIDPPYHPVSKYSDFTRYTKEKFYKEDQERLKEEIDKLTKKNVNVMLSNSDCDFITDLYKKYRIIKVQSGRTLNCKSDKRGKVSELLILNY